MTNRERNNWDTGTVVVALAGAIAAFAIAIGNGGAERSAVRHLPEAERQVLYERTLSTLATPCAPGTRAAGLDAFCRAQAAFVLEFSECDAACSALARHRLGGPSR